jgi:hypothetical protein
MKIYLASIISAGFLAGFTLVVNAAETSVSTIAGDGEERLLNGFGTDASFYNPSGMAVDNEGVIYVVDRQNHVIRKITPDGNVATLAGSGSPGFADGTGSAAKFKLPEGIAVDDAGNVYVADRTNHRIRRIDTNVSSASANYVTTFAGGSSGFADGVGTEAQFSYPSDVTMGPDGNLYVADQYNHSIRKITSAGEVTTLAGDGAQGTFDRPSKVAADSSGNIYVVDGWSSPRIRKVTPEASVTTFTNSGNDLFYSLAVDAGDNVIVGKGCYVLRIMAAGETEILAGAGGCGYVDGLNEDSKVRQAKGFAVESSSSIYFTDNDVIRKITIGNAPPQGEDQSLTMIENQSLNITLSGTDVDGDTLVAYALESSPGNGTLSGAAPNIIYTPDPNYYGTETFTFTVNDGEFDSDAATVAVHVLSYSEDVDNDGLSDASEFGLLAFGFDWQVIQEEMVTTLLSAGLYTGEQYEANRIVGQNDVVSDPVAFDLCSLDQIELLDFGLPQFERDSVTELFTLTFGVEMTTNLLDFDPVLMDSSSVRVNGEGNVEFQFESVEDSAYFRLKLE